MTRPNPPARAAARVLSARPPGYHDRSEPVALRASVALMFWYVLRLYLSRRN